MTALGVCLVLGSMLTLIQAASIESGNSTDLMQLSGLCKYEQKKHNHPHPHRGEFVPQCDKYGNFLPQQCWGSTGYCWCVNTITGEQIPNTETPPGVTPVNCGHKDFCPFGWSRFEKHCFVFIDSPKSWIEAEAYCLFEEANLASVHSGKDNRFLQALTRGSTYTFPLTWIGGYYNMDNWMWTDGSKFDYENWNVDYKPDSTRSCLQMNYGGVADISVQKKWINSNCNDMLPFVCAKTIIWSSTDASED